MVLRMSVGLMRIGDQVAGMAGNHMERLRSGVDMDIEMRMETCFIKRRG